MGAVRRSPVELLATDAEEPVRRAPANIAGVVQVVRVAELGKLLDEQPLHNASRLELHLVGEVTLAELDEDPDGGGVDVCFAELLDGHLHTLLRCAVVHVQLRLVLDEDGGEARGELRCLLLVRGVDARASLREVGGAGGDLDEGHMPLLVRNIGGLPYQIAQIE